jgi:hypothetical protein
VSGDDSLREKNGPLLYRTFPVNDRKLNFAKSCDWRQNKNMPIVHRVDVFVDEKLIETKDFTNIVAASQYADRRQEELDRTQASVRTNLESVQVD